MNLLLIIHKKLNSILTPLIGPKLEDSINENLDQDYLGWNSIRNLIEHYALYEGSLPPCVLFDNYDCDNCIAKELECCPIKIDEDYRSYLLYLRDCSTENKKNRSLRLDVLKRVLGRHKLPLHWEHVAVLAMKEAPDLFVSKNAVKCLLFFNPDVFTMVRDGVFSL